MPEKPPEHPAGHSEAPEQGTVISPALTLPGPAERTLSSNEEDLEGSFRKWNSANKGPEESVKPEVLSLLPGRGASAGLWSRPWAGEGLVRPLPRQS